LKKKKDTKGRPNGKKGNRRRKEPPITEEPEKNKTKNIKLTKN